MEKFLGFLKGFLSVILILIAFAFINAYLALQSTSKLVSKENITNIIKEVSFTDLIGEEAKQDLYDSLEEAGIPSESVEEVLENERFQEIVGGLISESFTAIIEDNDLPTIDEDELTDDLIEIFDIVVDETNMDITQKEITEVHKNIQENVSAIAKEMNNSSVSLEDLIAEDKGIYDEDDDSIESLREGIRVVQKVYKNRIWFLIVAIILLGLVVLLELKNLKFLKWIGSTLISYAIFFVLIGKAASALWNEFIVKELDEYEALLTVSFNSMIKTYYIAGIIFFVIGILLLVAKPLYEKYKNRNKELSSYY